MEEQNITIRTIIEKRIAESGKTKREVTELAGINSGNLNKMLDSPSWPTLERISQALGITVSELVSDAPASHIEPQQKCPYCGHDLNIKVE
jgi:lambda repressor-like predicted transcriptional regulator